MIPCQTDVIHRLGQALATTRDIRFHTDSRVQHVCKILGTKILFRYEKCNTPPTGLA